ncbi:MAG: sulfatase [Planctomycetota bacterium]|jgi:arylsulfatase
MKSKTNKIISASSIAVIIGVLVGSTCSACHIIANSYIQYKMFRLAALNLQMNLNKWVTISLVTVLAISIAVTLLSAVIKLVWKLLLSNVVEKRVKEKRRLIKYLSVAIICSAFFLYGGWVINHYYLPHKFHPLSLLSDLGILLFTIFLGWILIKVKSDILSKTIGTAKKISLALVIFLLVLNLNIVAYSKINLPKGPNVILLVVDAWRADSSGCYDKNSNATPNIDDFAKNAVLFENALAQSSCTINSAPSMFCSVYPFEHKYFNYKCRVSNKFNTIAEFLKNEGYQTFGISTNPHVTSRNGLDQGFDIFIEDTAWKNTDCDEVNSRFIEWLDSNKQKKFFAMLWYIDPHGPYDPPSEYIDKYIIRKEEKENISLRTKNHYKAKKGPFTAIEKRVTKKLYTGEVNFFDTEFHKLANYLKQNDLMKSSIIILTADHGEAFWEKGLLGHGSSLYEGQIKIPLIISLPNQKGGKVIPENVQHIDILPTILEYTKANDKTIDDPLSRGRSLKGLINGEKFKRKYLFSQLITNQYGPYYMECMRTDSFKLLSTYQIGKLSFTPPRFQLFDPNLEESERNVTDEHSKLIFTNLKKQLSFWEGNLEKNVIGPMHRKHEIEDDENKLKERLKSLGYLK